MLMCLVLEMVWKYMDNIKTARDRDKKLAITTFCFSPAIFYAMDVVPVSLEPLTVISTLVWARGTVDYLDFCCEVGFTETACSAQRGALGAYLAGLGEEIDFVVCDTPGVCDTNALAYAFAAAYLKKPFFQLNAPPTLVEDRSSTYHREDFKALIAFMEEQTGKKLEMDRLREILIEHEKQDDLIPDVKSLRIPVKYLANLLTGGKEEPVIRSLERMLAMRQFMRMRNVEGKTDTDVLDAAGLDENMVEDMYRYMAIANYEDRYVIPTGHREETLDAYGERGSCGFSFGNGCSSGNGDFDIFESNAPYGGRSSARPDNRFTTLYQIEED